MTMPGAAGGIDPGCAMVEATSAVVVPELPLARPGIGPANVPLG